MAKSSLEYSELFGLTLALSNLELVDVPYQDENWLVVTSWLRNRIKNLKNK